MKPRRSVIVALLTLLAGSFFTSCNEQPNQPVQPVVSNAVSLTKTSQRPIADFVGAQGTTSYFVPPAADFMGWYATNDNGSTLASVDFAGVSDRYLGGSLGTTFSGNIIETTLPDGRAEVKVNLHTRKTLMYILEAQNWDFATDPLLFGNRLHDVANGAAPGLCDSHYEIVFINSSPGAPLPDFMWAMYGLWVPNFPLLPSGYPWPGFDFVSMRINATADGPLHALAGLGPYGTPGHAKVVQVNLRPQTQNKGTRGDQWPVEIIDYKAR